MARGETDSKVAIVVDLGTGGPKVGLATLRGDVLWAEHHVVKTVRHADGGAEQDANEWWDLICAAVRRGIATGACRADQIAAVSITGQWASTVPVDGNGNPVGPVLLWMDTRARRLVRARFGGPAAGYHPKKVWDFVRRSGGAPSLDGADPTGHRLYLREQRRDIWDAARYLLEPVDYLSMRFTGVPSASAASMVAQWVCDTRDPSVTSYDPHLIELAGADLDKLPPLQPFGTVIADVATDVATELGLPERVQVVTGAPDLHTAALGSGAVFDYEAHMALSTTSWVSCPVPKKKTDVLHSIASVPGLTPDRYIVANSQETAGRAFQWLRDVLNRPGIDERDYSDLATLAATAAPGAGGVVFTPWLDGERAPVTDRHARAGFHRVSLATTQADLVRAVMEGVACNARWLFETTEKFVGRRLDPVRLMGGGASSDLWCAIVADVLDRTVEQVENPLFTGLRGAALSAGLALDEVERREIRSLVPVRATYRPDPANRSVYDRSARSLPRLYAAEKRVFKRRNTARPTAKRR
jgi:xylulokinase